jgi:hypothetical protein
MASIAEVVKRLEELTAARKIQWRRMDAPSSVAVGTDSRVPAFFGATFKGRHVGVYEERFRAFDIETETSYWSNRYVLAFFDESWEIAWEAPTMPGVGRLYDAIKYQNADVDSILNDIMEKSD